MTNATAPVVDAATIQQLQQVLTDANAPIAKRFRSLFTLRGLAGPMAIDAMAAGLNDSSALLKHEIAYCLGQMGDEYAFPILERVLAKTDEHPMVRHEAAEGIGALATSKSMDVLKKYVNDPTQEVAETCQLAVSRVDWFENHKDEPQSENSAYLSVDPAPALPPAPVPELKSIFLDHTLPIFQRYRAMFALRDHGSDESVLALADAFITRPTHSSSSSSSTPSSEPLPLYHSALLKHEVAFVLGQLQNVKAVPALKTALADANENPMVRHEAAEALGAIASEQEAVPLLQQYKDDPEPIVAESCVVALDVADYFNNTEEFQYADGLKLLLEKNVDAIKKPSQ